MRIFDHENRNGARTSALALFIALAVLICHGAMGSLHLPAETPVGSHMPHASHEAGHTNHEEHEAGHGGLLAAHHEAEIEYFAVLSLFFLAALLFALRPKFERLPARVTASFERVRRGVAATPFPRGPTLSSLQVFTL
jgi:hypothetical protein